MNARIARIAASPRARRHPHRWRLAFLAAGLLVACSGGEGTSGEAPPGGWSLPTVDLEAMGEEPRRRLAAAREAVERARAAGDGMEQAAALGALGGLYLAYHEFGASAECYRIAADLEPRDPRWPYLEGLALLADGRDGEAERALEAAHRLAPEDVPTLLRLARLRLARGERGAARAAYEKALTLDPQSAAALQGLGRLAIEAGELEIAAARLERALELQPRATSLHYQLGQVYRRLGNEQRARDHLARAGEGEVVFADPVGRSVSREKVTTALDMVLEMAGDADAVDDASLLGFAISQFGDVAGAVDQLERLLGDRQAGLGPLELARARYVLGALKAGQRDWPGALEEFTAALESAPRFAPARIQRASMLARLGDSAAALAALDELLAESPREPQALLRRAAILTEAGRPLEALPDLEQVVALLPESSEAALRLASAYESLRRAEPAAREYRRALGLAMEPADRALAHYRLAELGGAGPGASLADYEAALEIDPSFHQARLGRAALLGRTGRLAEAAAEYRVVTESEPRIARAWLGEAAALILGGRHREAAERLELALQVLPSDPQIAATLARHLAASPDLSARNGGRALELAQRLASNAPSLQVSETLAMALAESGRYAEAADLQTRLVDEADPREQPRLSANLERYRRRQACCAAPERNDTGPT